MIHFSGQVYSPNVWSHRHWAMSGSMDEHVQYSAEQSYLSYLAYTNSVPLVNVPILKRGISGPRIASTGYYRSEVARSFGTWVCSSWCTVRNLIFSILCASRTRCCCAWQAGDRINGISQIGRCARMVSRCAEHIWDETPLRVPHGAQTVLWPKKTYFRFKKKKMFFGVT